VTHNDLAWFMFGEMSWFLNKLKMSKLLTVEIVNDTVRLLALRLCIALVKEYSKVITSVHHDISMLLQMADQLKA
jgi:hypothetical protein